MVPVPYLLNGVLDVLVDVRGLRSAGRSVIGIKDHDHLPVATTTPAAASAAWCSALSTLRSSWTACSWSKSSGSGSPRSRFSAMAMADWTASARSAVLLAARFLGAGSLPSASCRASRSLSRTKSKLAVIPNWDFRRSFICSAVSPCRLQESSWAGSNFLEAGMMVISPRGPAGKPLAGFRATPDRRIIVLCGMIVSVIRFKNPLLHRQSSLRKRRLGENRGFRPSF